MTLYAEALAAKRAEPVSQRLRDHAHRLAIETRAYISEAQAVLASRERLDREGIDQLSALSLATDLLRQATAAHEKELSVRHWACVELSPAHVVLVVGAWGEERSEGFVTGLVGAERSCVWPARSPRSIAWHEGWTRGRYLLERRQSRETMNSNETPDSSCVLQPAR